MKFKNSKKGMIKNYGKERNLKRFKIKLIYLRNFWGKIRKSL